MLCLTLESMSTNIKKQLISTVKSASAKVIFNCFKQNKNYLHDYLVSFSILYLCCVYYQRINKILFTSFRQIKTKSTQLLHSCCLCLNLHFLKYDALGVRGTPERIGLPSRAQMCLFVVLVGPTLFTTMSHVFTCSTKPARFTLIIFNYNKVISIKHKNYN